MVERRNISRVDYSAKGVVVVCDTGEKYMVETKNVSPLGMGVVMPADSPDIVGKDGSNTFPFAVRNESAPVRSSSFTVKRVLLVVLPRFVTFTSSGFAVTTRLLGCFPSTDLTT